MPLLPGPPPFKGRAGIPVPEFHFIRELHTNFSSAARVGGDTRRKVNRLPVVTAPVTYSHITGRVKTIALGIAALREDEKSSFTPCKLRFFVFSRLALPSLVTFLHGLIRDNEPGQPNRRRLPLKLHS